MNFAKGTVNHGYKGGDIIKHKFVIKGRLPSLNEYCNAERKGYHCANGMKHRCQNVIIGYIRRFKLKPIRHPVKIQYRFYEPNKRRDKDNISAIAHKFIQDAIVEAGILRDDGWDYITGFSDEFYIDKLNPRIEVELIEERTKT